MSKHKPRLYGPTHGGLGRKLPAEGLQQKKHQMSNEKNLGWLGCIGKYAVRPMDPSWGMSKVIITRWWFQRFCSKDFKSANFSKQRFLVKKSINPSLMWNIMHVSKLVHHSMAWLIPLETVLFFRNRGIESPNIF